MGLQVCDREILDEKIGVTTLNLEKFLLLKYWFYSILASSLPNFTIIIISFIGVISGSGVLTSGGVRRGGGMGGGAGGLVGVGGAKRKGG